MYSVQIDEETLQDIVNIETGLLYPLNGFMNQEEFHSVIDHYTVCGGEVFTIPITLAVQHEQYQKLKVGDELNLSIKGNIVAQVAVSDKFEIRDGDIEKIFGTLEKKHPGVFKEIEKGCYRVAGKTRLLDKSLLINALKPETTKQIFLQKGWKTIVGFQTRNPIHKAHEHLQRIGLEICDGLFINPIVGWKKEGDFTEEAVLAAYNKMIEEFYPSDRVYMEGLKTQMRYAGPREAIFHAIIRRNLGCTHFIIGRDHAGVGGYYKPYEAHDFAKKIEQNYKLGINLLLLKEPYYCNKCGQIVSEKTCSHYQTERVEISGTIIRKYINEGNIPNEIMLRKEIFKSIQQCNKIFID